MAHRLLYLVRPGAHDSDPGDPLDGGSLTELGRQQVSLLADRLDGVDLTTVHHSSALRAVQTADVLAFRLPEVPRHSDDLLRECIPTVPAEESLTPRQREFFAQLPARARQEGPARAAEVIARYTTVGDTDSAELVITHGNLINQFVAHAMGAPDTGWLRLTDYHCGLTVIRCADDGPPRILGYNDVGHLPPELRGLDYPPELRV